MKIAVAGTGYVGLANAVLFAVNNEVTAFDIDKKRIELLEKKISPIKKGMLQTASLPLCITQ